MEHLPHRGAAAAAVLHHPGRLVSETSERWEERPLPGGGGPAGPGGQHAGGRGDGAHRPILPTGLL